MNVNNDRGSCRVPDAERKPHTGHALCNCIAFGSKNSALLRTIV
jgi:hypothetical protein